MRITVSMHLSGSDELMLQKFKDSFTHEMDDALALRTALRVACEQMGIIDEILKERGVQ